MPAKSASAKPKPPKLTPLCEVAGLTAVETAVPTRVLLTKYKKAPATTPCPFKAKIDEVTQPCTKDKKNKPIPVCSIYDRRDGTESVAITCPFRFLEDGTVLRQIEKDLLPALPQGGSYKWVSELSLYTTDDEQLGRVDYVGATLDAKGEVLGLVNVEFQAVYSSGSTRLAFDTLVKAVAANATVAWDKMRAADYPKTDFISSWKRIKYQVLEKGSGLVHPQAQDATTRIPVTQVLVIDSWFYAKVLARANGRLVPVGRDQGSDLTIYSCSLVPDATTGARRLAITSTLHTTVAHFKELAVEAKAADIPRFIRELRKKKQK